jgi:hypothetical protein
LIPLVPQLQAAVQKRVKHFAKKRRKRKHRHSHTGGSAG